MNYTIIGNSAAAVGAVEAIRSHDRKGEIIVVLASDCMIPPHGLKHAKTPGKSVWMSGVIDMDSGVEYLCLGRIAPYGWFMSWNRNNIDVWWDEE